ncbi:hypothetical protein EV714DRAFT_198549 [Schizophyllum commune]
MKRNGITPDQTTYDTLARTLTSRGLHRDVWALLEDMEALDVKPSQALLIEMAKNTNTLSSVQFWDILDVMKKHDIRPTASTWTSVIQQFAHAGNVELALESLYNVREDGLEPELPAAEAVIALLSDKGFINLAMDVIEWFEGFAIRRVGPETWMRCLEGAAAECRMDAILKSWQKAVVEYNHSPSEGLCLEILTAAARHGKAEFAISQVLTTLVNTDIALSTKHIAPVIEAYAAAGNLTDAFTFLHTLPSFKVEAPVTSLEAIAVYCLPDIDAIDNAWKAVDQLHTETKVTTAALNTIIIAAAKHSDLQRALGAYKNFPTYHAQPNTDTFDILLDACIPAEHRQLGDALLADMKTANVPLARSTYERLVRLCLTQPEYDDAFFYLNEMEAAGHVPSLQLYSAIVRRCASEGDTRYEVALGEMKTRKMAVPKELMGEVRALTRQSRKVSEVEAAEKAWKEGGKRAFEKEMKVRGVRQPEVDVDEERYVEPPEVGADEMELPKGHSSRR